MVGVGVLLTSWQWQPTVVVGCAALVAAYFMAIDDRSVRSWLYLSGVLTLLVALVSPIDTLGDHYLFSVHMAQHLLLILVVPPLLLLGLPPEAVKRLLQRTSVRRTEHILSHPAIAWLLGMGTLWVWHLPLLYDAALLNEGIHSLEHLSFLITAVIFWWPVLSPLRSLRLSAPAAGLYLFAAYLASSLLGVLITFAPAGIYTPYVHPVDVLGILPMIRNQWGLSVASDQQIGGLLMWVLGGLPYFITTWVLFVRWYLEDREEPAAKNAEQAPSDANRVAVAP